MSYACLAGVSVIVLLIPANRWLAVKIQKANDRMMLHKDARVKRMGDLLHGIRHIKTAAWEQVFAERVRTASNREARAEAAAASRLILPFSVLTGRAHCHARIVAEKLQCDDDKHHCNNKCSGLLSSAMHYAGARGSEAGDAAAGHHQAAGRVLRLLLGVHVAPVRGLHVQPVRGAEPPLGANARLYHSASRTCCAYPAMSAHLTLDGTQAPSSRAYRHQSC